VAYFTCGLVAAVASIPVVLEQAADSLRFQDRLGRLPVEVSLAHNGVFT
jgi:hypothetical protein